MGAEIIFKGDIFGDCHLEYYPIDPDECSSNYPIRTLGELLFDSDYYINLGDNSGKHSVELFNVMNNKELENIVSIPGNHDISLLFGKERVRGFYKHKIEDREIKTLKKNKYGRFGDTKKDFKIIEKKGFSSDYKAYFHVLESDVGPVISAYRHHPFMLSRQNDLYFVNELIKEIEPVCFYMIGAHSHEDVVKITSKKKEVGYSDEKIPIVSIVIPPYTLGRFNENLHILQHLSYPKQPYFYASIIHTTIRSD